MVCWLLEQKNIMKAIFKYPLFTIFPALLFFSSFAQQNKIDSLLALLKTPKEACPEPCFGDTGKVNLLNNLSWEYVKTGEYGTSIRTGNDALKLSAAILELNKEKEKDPAVTLTSLRQQAKSLNNIGSAYREQGKFPRALEYFLKALKISEKLGNRGHVASNLGNIGLVYYNQGSNAKALKYFHKALYLLLPAANSQTNDNTPDKSNAAAIYGNIGNVYKELGDNTNILFPERDSLYQKALENYQKALKIKEELGDRRGIAIWLGNIGSVYKDQAEMPVPMEAKGGHDGSAYRTQLYSKSLEYYFRALKINKETGNKIHTSAIMGEMGSLYTSLNKYGEAENYLLNALSVSDSIGALELKKEQLNSLSSLYFAKGEAVYNAGNKAASANEFKKAFEYYRQSGIAKDSVFNEEKNNEITRQEMSYEFEKKEAAAQAAYDKQAAVAAEENKKQKIIIWSVISGLLAVAVFASLIFRSLRISNRQKRIIEIQKNEVSRQKEMVEKHQKEIIDSINYAKRLQEAILPSFSLIKKILPDSFVLHLPKDIVAGDFYWAHLSSGNKLIFAVVDCTGHGIPGAFMSMVGNTLLNKIVIENKTEETDEILKQLKLGIIQTLKQTGSPREQKDGMDIALCAWDRSISGINHAGVGDANGAGTLSFSGAHNPLYHFRNGIITEFKGARQTISFQKGKESPFLKHTIELVKGDTLYIFTDGFADQKGGKEGRKFYYHALQELLASVQKFPMEEQLNIVKKTFDEWKGNQEQVDDVTLVGVRV